MASSSPPKANRIAALLNPFIRSRDAETERDALARRGGIREVVFGVQDGLLTTMGLTTGVATATAGAAVSHTTILIAGLAGALAGMVSMGTGAYLATCAERDLKAAAIHKERGELRNQPGEEHAEMVNIFMKRGVPAETAEELSLVLAKFPLLWEETHIEKELGISSDPKHRPIKDGMLMAATFLVGAVIPIIAYIFLSGTAAVLVSLAVSAVALGALGAGKAAVIGQRLPVGAAQVLGVGTAAALAGYVLGVLLPHLFGLRLPPA
jgi:VIT1/CCC1 family predicted Fe2+/Mn2+ transporter